MNPGQKPGENKPEHANPSHDKQRDQGRDPKKQGYDATKQTMNDPKKQQQEGMKKP